MNFRLQINTWWLVEQQGQLGNPGLTHREMQKWVKASRRVAKFWQYAPRVEGQILRAAEAVEKTIQYAETNYGPTGHPRRIRERTLAG